MMSHTFLHMSTVNHEYTQRKLEREEYIHPVSTKIYSALNLSHYAYLACFLRGWGQGWHLIMAFSFFFSGHVALCQLTHLIPALTITNDKGAARFIYLCTEKLKKRKIEGQGSVWWDILPGDLFSQLRTQLGLPLLAPSVPSPSPQLSSSFALV